MRSFDLILIWFCKNSHVTVLGIKKCKTGLKIWCQMFKFILRLLTANLRKLWNIRRSGSWLLSFRRRGWTERLCSACWTARADGNPAGLQKSQVTVRGLISANPLQHTLHSCRKHHSLNESPVRTSQHGAPCKSRRHHHLTTSIRSPAHVCPITRLAARSSGC